MHLVESDSWRALWTVSVGSLTVLRQEYWRCVAMPSSRGFSHPGIDPISTRQILYMCGSAVKESSIHTKYNVGKHSWESPQREERPQYSGLENSSDCIVHGYKSRTGLTTSFYCWKMCVRRDTELQQRTLSVEPVRTKHVWSHSGIEVFWLLTIAHSKAQLPSLISTVKLWGLPEEASVAGNAFMSLRPLDMSKSASKLATCS